MQTSKFSTIFSTMAMMNRNTQFRSLCQFPSKLFSWSTNSSATRNSNSYATTTATTRIAPVNSKPKSNIHGRFSFLQVSLGPGLHVSRCNSILLQDICFSTTQYELVCKSVVDDEFGKKNAADLEVKILGAIGGGDKSLIFLNTSRYKTTAGYKCVVKLGLSEAYYSTRGSDDGEGNKDTEEGNNDMDPAPANENEITEVADTAAIANEDEEEDTDVDIMAVDDTIDDSPRKRRRVDFDSDDGEGNSNQNEAPVPPAPTNQNEETQEGNNAVNQDEEARDRQQGNSNEGSVNFLNAVLEIFDHYHYIDPPPGRVPLPPANEDDTFTLLWLIRTIIKRITDDPSYVIPDRDPPPPPPASASVPPPPASVPPAPANENENMDVEKTDSDPDKTDSDSNTSHGDEEDDTYIGISTLHKVIKRIVYEPSYVIPDRVPAPPAAVPPAPENENLDDEKTDSDPVKKTNKSSTSHGDESNNNDDSEQNKDVKKNTGSDSRASGGDDDSGFWDLF